jgi:hypothetical protein
MQPFETLLINQLSSITVAAAFLWYLSRKDKQNNDIYRQFNQTLEDFNKTLNNHLEHWSKSQTKLAKDLQKLTDCIRKIDGKTV